MHADKEKSARQATAATKIFFMITPSIVGVRTTEKAITQYSQAFAAIALINDKRKLFITSARPCQCFFATPQKFTNEYSAVDGAFYVTTPHLQSAC
ncbi:MAG: hypothetical protein OXR62_04520 [Ahrensia sp.]|nr:hypothetical protein [Ahrensia sp.]